MYSCRRSKTNPPKGLAGAGKEQQHVSGEKAGKVKKAVKTPDSLRGGMCSEKHGGGATKSRI